MNKINAVIQKINNDIEYKTYFFRKAPNYQNLDLWLKPLYDNNHLKNIDNLNTLYLEKVALENKENEKEDITILLVQIIDNSIINKNKKDFRESWYILKVIFNMLPKNIKIEYIDFIRQSLKEDNNSRIISPDIGSLVLPTLLDNKMKNNLLELVKILFDYEINDTNKSYQERKSLVEKYWLFDLMEKSSKEIVKQIRVDGLIILIDIIEKIMKEDKGSFNNIWIITIEKHSQNSFPDRYDNQLISFTRDLLEELNFNESKEYVKRFIKSEYSIFKRLAFHTINYHYNDLKDIFWEWFYSDDNIINSTFRHEYYKLLEDRSNEFSITELNLVIEWIQKLDYSKYYNDIEEEQLKEISAFRKKEWLLTIKDFSKEANKLYVKYNKISPSEIEHPGFDSWSYGVQSIDHSHIKNKEEFCSQSVSVIVKYIENFNPDKIKKDMFDTNQNLIDGLANDLSNCIKNNPKKFVDEIDLFDNLDYLHKYHIIYGFRNAWKEKINFDWTNLFKYINKTLNKTFFESSDKYSFWIKGEVASLIEYGTKSDDHAFDKTLLPNAKEILFSLLDNIDDEKIEHDDLILNILNTPDGKVLHALINYTLRYGRSNSTEKVKWEEDIKQFFTEQLAINNNYSLYIFTILGEYLPNLLFLDKNWIECNFNKIFSLKNNNLWEVSISGYFSYSTIVYKNIYNDFKKYNHLKKAIKYTFKNEKAKEKIIQHICIAYIGDFDNDTIFNVLKNKNKKSIINVINFIWHSYRYSSTIENILKINSLWKKIYKLYNNEIGDDIQEIFSHLSEWFVFIDKIDESNIAWLKLSAKYTERNFNSYMIIEQLLRLVEKNTKYVGVIYLEMLENGIFPDYKDEGIKSIVSTMAKFGEKDNAIKIINIYAKKGMYFLKDII